jgi:lipopolysaccharide transport system ATP-binding protein
LKDVSFDVKRGEVVGIIGRNGAGKSTLLKILTQITEPTTGRAELNGRVGSLLEVGTGFHQELTGRENIYLSGAILGMRRTNINRKFDEIVDFSGVDKFIDTPVKRYSSGMKVRLGFAVAAHLDPEILLVDEVLAVGDAAFQTKCLGKMGEVAGSGRTVLFVSHNMAAIENLCDRAVLLEMGELCVDGLSTRTVQEYYKLFSPPTGAGELIDVHRAGSGEVRFESVELLSLDAEKVSSIAVGEGLTIRMRLVSTRAIQDVELGVGLFSSQGIRLAGLNSHDLSHFTVDFESGQRIAVECGIPKLNLAPGNYRLNLVARKPNRENADFVEQAVTFDVVPTDIYGTGRLPQGRYLIVLDAGWAILKD